MGREFVVMNVNEKGDFREVPALCVNDLTVVVVGGWLKTAKIQDELWLDFDSVIDPAQIIAKLKQEKMGADILYFAQKLPHLQPLFNFKTGLKNTAAIPIQSYADWWENKLSQDTRRNVRISAKRGVTVKSVEVSDALVEGIVKIYNETPIRQGRQFWHYGRSAGDVKRDYSEFLDKSEILGAFHENELIGFVKLVYIGEIASVLQFLCMNKHHDKRPANALISAAVELCANKGLKYLVYGRYIYDDYTDSLLTEFKRRNGFEQFFVPLYFIPLTLKGRIAMKFNVHQSFKTLVPKRIKNIGRKLRTRILISKSTGKAIDGGGK